MTGFVFINKPQGITSFVAAAKVRRLFGEKKTGHTGTLDPMATGVLPVALGGATRFIELLESHNKRYTATFLLGKRTDTLDITGTVVETSDVTATRADVEKTLECFKGEIMQTPPMYSAIKQDGKRLYDLARQGIEVERKQRSVKIYSLELLCANEEKGEYAIDVSCSGGTYIRSLIDDIGKVLSCPAVMTALTRTEANGIDISRCYTFESLEKMKVEGTLLCALSKTDELICYDKIFVSAAQARRFSNGGELDLQRVKNLKTDVLLYNVYSPENAFLGVGSVNKENGTLDVRKVFVEK